MNRRNKKKKSPIENLTGKGDYLKTKIVNRYSEMKMIDEQGTLILDLRRKELDPGGYGLFRGRRQKNRGAENREQLIKR